MGRRFAQFLLVVALLVLPPSAFTGAFASPTTNHCGALPDVPWWGKTEDIPAYVKRVHFGDWSAYIAKWQAQLERMEYLDVNRLAAASPDQRHILRGPALNRHVAKIRQRLKIIDCLAQGGLPRVPDAPAANGVEHALLLLGDPVQGNITAEQSGCNNCHGRNPPAAHPAIPHLAGQNAFYLVSQLLLYRQATNEKTRPFSLAARHEEFMDYFAEGLTDEAIYDIAAYYAGLACASVPAQARQPSGFIHNCESCHGNEPKRYFPEIPRLAGQKADYLIKQLRRFRFYAQEPDRPSHPEKRYHFAMSDYAKPLTNEMIAEAARFYASQPCTAN